MSIAFVQSNTAGNGSSSSPTVALSGVSSSNALILVSVFGTASGTISSVTGGGTWSKLTGIISALGCDLEMWWCAAPTGGSTTVTVNYSTAPYSQSSGLWLTEWSGIASVDQTGTPADSNGTTANSPTLTPTVSGDLVLDIMTFQNTPSVNPSTPWNTPTGPAWYGGSAGGAFGIAYQITSSTSALTASWTTTGDWVTIGVAFKAATVAGPMPSSFFF